MECTTESTFSCCSPPSSLFPLPLPPPPAFLLFELPKEEDRLEPDARGVVAEARRASMVSLRAGEEEVEGRGGRTKRKLCSRLESLLLESETGELESERPERGKGEDPKRRKGEKEGGRRLEEEKERKESQAHTKNSSFRRLAQALVEKRREVLTMRRRS